MKIAHDGGFSLVELVVVLVIIGILIAVATPTLMGPRRAAQDTAAQATLVAAVKTEEVFATDDGTYSSDAAVLSVLEPSLDWSGVADGSVHVVVGALPDEDTSVLVYTRSNSGAWFGMRMVRSGADGGRYECQGDARVDVDDPADCLGHDW
jgi:type IV pilus assembly protein PilA